MTLLDRLSLTMPIIQAPMAGVSTPRMAAEVSNSGALGSIAVGAMTADEARRAINQVRSLTDRAFNVNVFVHARPRRDPVGEADWLIALHPLFEQFGAQAPETLDPPYLSFNDDDDMLEVLTALAPPVVSFHFGLPTDDRIAALKRAGCMLLASATNLEEALAARKAGIDAVVAQGFEAGGHRGAFDPDAPDAQFGLMPLTRLLVAHRGLPVISAGAIMDGKGVRAVLDLGAVAAQLGTAFILCPESSADPAWRAALRSEAAHFTVMTRVISGRPARCLSNHFTAWEAHLDRPLPDYPVAYSAGKALNSAAKAAGATGFGAQWAGQGAPLARELPAADLVRSIYREAQQ